MGELLVGNDDSEDGVDVVNDVVCEVVSVGIVVDDVKAVVAQDVDDDNGDDDDIV